MSWLARVWAAFRAWVGLRFRRLPPVPEPSRPAEPPPSRYRVVHSDEEPDELEPMLVYAIGEGAHLWHVAMRCPCGCGAKIQLNALADASPRWTFIEREGFPTITPSVWRKVGCRSHFFIRDGRVDWC